MVQLFSVTSANGSFFLGIGSAIASPQSKGGGHFIKKKDSPYYLSRIGGGTRSQVYGDIGRGNASFNNFRSFPFGFFPIFMPNTNLNSNEEYTPSIPGFYRPGGDMGAHFVISRLLGPDAGRFYLIGDFSSVSVVQVELVNRCNATSLDEPFTAFTYPIYDGTNTTRYPEATEIIQFYRASSFALALSGFNASALPEGAVSVIDVLPDSVDRAFLQCINSTIASTIPIMDNPKRPMNSAAPSAIIIIGMICTLSAITVCTWLIWRMVAAIKRRAATEAMQTQSGRVNQPSPPRQIYGSLRSQLSFSNSQAFTLMTALATMLVTSVAIYGSIVLRAGEGEDSPMAKAESIIASAETGSGIFLEGTIGGWDLGSKTLALRLVPMLCKINGDGCRKSFKEDMFFFQNGDALGEDGFNQSNAVLEFKSRRQNIDFDQAINTEVRQYALTERSGGLVTDAKFPRDKYSVKTLIAATHANLTKTVPIFGAWLLNDMQTEWKFTLTFRHIHVDSQAAKLSIKIDITRTSATAISAILIVVLNWIITLGIVGMTATYSFDGSNSSLYGLETAAALPIAALFALPAMRNVMPGQPPLGCFIDFFGIIPNLILCGTSVRVSYYGRVETSGHFGLLVALIEATFHMLSYKPKKAKPRSL